MNVFLRMVMIVLAMLVVNVLLLESRGRRHITLVLPDKRFVLPLHQSLRYGEVVKLCQPIK